MAASAAEVLVIGAGAAGLTAAYDLKREGVEVLVLEATSMMGGRVRKLEGFADFPMDLGGEWIPRVGPRILDKIVDDPSVKVDVKTTRYNVKVLRGWQTDGKWTDLKCDLSTDYKFSGSTWYDFFHDYIGKSLEGRIKYDRVVHTINYSSTDRRVIVLCKDGSVFQSDQVIVTVPLKILQDGDIMFDPPLAPERTRALQQATFGSGLKVFIEFTEKFYHDRFGFFNDYDTQLNDDAGERCFYDACYGQDTVKHIMGIAMVGDPAQRFLGLDDDEVVHELLKELDEAYKGIASSTFVKSHVLNWYNEPYARGSYSTYENGTEPMIELSKDVDRRLFFAGEHLPWGDPTQYGYVHGAALSGRAAATSVCSVRDGQDPPTAHGRRHCCAKAFCLSV